MIEIFKRIFKEKVETPVKKKRSLKGGLCTRFSNWISATLTKVNDDLNRDYLLTITKCREMAKNDPIVRSYLSNVCKNVIGKSGFVLQCQIKNDDDSLAVKLNDEIEWNFYEWGKSSNDFLTMIGGEGHNDFDALILRTLLIDGEVFIRIHKNARNPYGLSFELIDAAAIDWTKKREASPRTERDYTWC